MKKLLYILMLVAALLVSACLDFSSLNAGGDTTESGNFISGTVLSGADPVKTGKVYLNKLTVAAPATYAKIDSTDVTTEGTYEFEYTETATLYVSYKTEGKEYKITADFAYAPSDDGTKVAAVDYTKSTIIDGGVVVYENNSVKGDTLK